MLLARPRIWAQSLTATTRMVTHNKRFEEDRRPKVCGAPSAVKLCDLGLAKLEREDQSVEEQQRTHGEVERPNQSNTHAALDG